MEANTATNTSSWTDHPRAVWPVALAIIFQVFAALAVALRFYSHYLKRQKIAAHDVTIIVGLIFSAGLVALLIIATVIGGLGQHAAELPNPLEQVVNFAKVYVANSPVWAVAISAVKISILQLYISIFTSKPFRYSCFGLIAVQCLWCIMVILVSLLLCRPLKANWDPTVEGHCGSTKASYLVVHIMNLILDVAVAITPIPQLWKLHMARRKKIELSVMFALGTAICVITIFRITLINAMVSDDLTYSTSTLFFFTILEPLLGIILACLPFLRPIVQKITGNDVLSSGSRTLDSSYASSKLKSDRSAVEPSMKSNKRFNKRFSRRHGSLDSTAEINALTQNQAHGTKIMSQPRTSLGNSNISAIQITNTFDVER